MYRRIYMTNQQKFTEISASELSDVHNLIGKEWMLITAQDGEGANAMTASWGALGELWGKHVAFCFIRPQRYTFGLAEGCERMSLAFLGEDYRDALKICGTRSGRDSDKISDAGLSVSVYDGVPIINEAHTVVIGKKLYADDIKKDCFSELSMLEHYKQNDFHRMYILEIQKVLIRK